MFSKIIPGKWPAAPDLPKDLVSLVTVPMSTKESEELEERLNYQHPVYQNRQNIWWHINNFVEGAPALIRHVSEYCPPFLGEDPEAYQHRLSNFTYAPVLTRAVDLLVSKLCTGQVLCTSKTPELQRIIDGTNPLKLSAAAMRSWLLYGVSVVTYDRRGEDVRPVLIDPLELINWGRDDSGMLSFAVIKRRFSRSKRLEKAQTVTQWMVFDPETIETYEKVENHLGDSTGVKLVKKDNHRSGVCPLSIFNPPSELWTGSMSYLLQKEHVCLLNIQLAAAANVYIQRTYSPVLTPDQDLTSTYYDSASEHVAPNNHVVTGDFNFKEPAGSSIETLTNLLREIESRIRSIVAMTPVDTEAPVESGLSKRYDHAEMMATLSLYGDHLRTWLEEIYLLMGSILWIQQTSVEVTGFDRFEIDNLDILLSHAQAIENLGDLVVPTARNIFFSTLNCQIAGPSIPKRLQSAINKEVMAIPTASPSSDDWS